MEGKFFLHFLSRSTHPGQEKIKKDIKLASLLFDRYVDVIRSIDDWNLMTYESSSKTMSRVTDTIESYVSRCETPVEAPIVGIICATQQEDPRLSNNTSVLLAELFKDSIKVTALG